MHLSQLTCKRSISNLAELHLFITLGCLAALALDSIPGIQPTSVWCWPDASHDHPLPPIGPTFESQGLNGGDQANPWDQPDLLLAVNTHTQGGGKERDPTCFQFHGK